MAAEYDAAIRAAICRRIADIRAEIAKACQAAERPLSAVTLMAVTKTVPPQQVNVAVAEGITCLGENRVQEFLSKRADYDPRAQVQFIGHLQTNKVRQVVGLVSMIHSVDSLHLAAAIDKAAAAQQLVQDVLLEVNVGKEASKSGVLPENLPALLHDVTGLSHIRVRGLMVIPPPAASEEAADAMFSQVAALYRSMQAQVPLDVLSMGMSGDFPAAIRHGATVIRLGSAIFGKRPPLAPPVTP